MQWFRMYAKFATDLVVQSLAFEDQRHYVILLCLKCDGILDRDIPRANKERLIYRGLGLDPHAAEEAKKRLMEAKIIDKNWQPKGWDKLQFKSDDSTTRVRKMRKTKETPAVTVTEEERFSNAPETEADTETEADISVPNGTLSGKPDVTPKPRHGETAKRVLDFLNLKTGKAFQPTPSNLDLIVARLREGYDEDMCRSVVARKVRAWKDDDKMREYLRPATLFNREKFNQYAGECVE